ncbi:RNA recognition motif-containing protein [Dinochytrium kinnereticum]|nr:RNA recognition motif-containing protein [Dinochytrium kinnereticum]
MPKTGKKASTEVGVDEPSPLLPEVTEEPASEEIVSADVEATDTPVKKKGKGKENKEAHDGRSKSTIFVRGIPFEATSSELEAFFSEVGPVRSCFVVASANEGGAPEEATAEEKEGERPGKVNKGYGFVTYAVAEDAERALSELKDAKFGGGRKLKLELAMRKSATKDEVKSTKPPVARKNPHPTAAPKAIYKKAPTSVKIINIKSDVTKKQLNHKVKKLGTVIELTFPVENDSEAVDGKLVAHVQFRTSADAEYAVKKLNDHVFKGDKIQASLLENVKAQQPDPEKDARKFRLIIRNLSFRCETSHLETAFKAFGTVKEVVIPVKPDGKKRGFGFVQMSSMEEAEKAMAGMNEKEIQGREIAVDWSLPKSVYEQSKEVDALFDQNAEVGDESKDTKKSSESVSEGEDAEGVTDGMDVDEDEGEEDQSAENDDDEEEADEEDDGHGVHDGDSESDDGDDDESGEEDEDDDGVKVTFEKGEDGDGVLKQDKPKKPLMDTSDIEKHCTIFIRNLPFETTEEELKERFSTFGELKYALVTKDPVTGRSRGTAFVNFKEADDAQKCMVEFKAAEKSGLFLDGAAQAEIDKKKKRAKGQDSKSILVPEPAMSASPFVMGGRFLNLTFAVKRDDAAKFMEENTVKRRANDRRNMYLLKEGAIFAKSDAAIGVNPAELEKRQKSFTERRRLLESNPNLFISKTRLSVRNLGPKVTDAGLKRVAILAVKRFWDEVSEGTRKGLEKEVIDEEIEEGHEKPSSTRQIKLTQVKLMKDKENLDAKTKKPQSKGFGFIEFGSHADALTCLRWLNNNPLGFDADGRPLSGEEVKEAIKEASKGGEELTFKKSQRRPIVEFAIENRLILKQKAERQLRDKQRKEEEAAEKGEDGEETEKRKRKPRKDRRKSAADREGQEAPEGVEGAGAKPKPAWNDKKKVDQAKKGDASPAANGKKKGGADQDKKGDASPAANGKRKAEAVPAAAPTEESQGSRKKQKKGKKDGHDEDGDAAMSMDLEGTMEKLMALLEKDEYKNDVRPLDKSPDPIEKTKPSPSPKPQAQKGKQTPPSPASAAPQKGKPTSQTPAKQSHPTPAASAAKATPSAQSKNDKKRKAVAEPPTPTPAKRKANEATTPPATTGKKVKEQKPLTKAEKRDEKDEADFVNMLKKYGKGFFGGSDKEGEKTKKKVGEVTGGEAASFKKWYTE